MFQSVCYARWILQILPKEWLAQGRGRFDITYWSNYRHYSFESLTYFQMLANSWERGVDRQGKWHTCRHLLTSYNVYVPARQSTHYSFTSTKNWKQPMLCSQQIHAELDCSRTDWSLTWFHLDAPEVTLAANSTSFSFVLPVLAGCSGMCTLRSESGKSFFMHAKSKLRGRICCLQIESFTFTLSMYFWADLYSHFETDSNLNSSHSILS